MPIDEFIITVFCWVEKAFADQGNRAMQGVDNWLSDKVAGMN